MKTSNILLAVSALLTHVMALPADSDADVLNTFLPPRDLSPTSGDGAQLDRRCTWNDGHGVVPCDTFAIIWGDNTWSGGTSRITIAGSNFKSVFTANCDNGNAWEGFSTMLPFVVSVQMGNACKFGLRIPGEIYDGTHVKYANQYLNTPTDPRCSRVGQLNKGQRCLIRQRP